MFIYGIKAKLKDQIFNYAKEEERLNINDLFHQNGEPLYVSSNGYICSEYNYKHKEFIISKESINHYEKTFKELILSYGLSVHESTINFYVMNEEDRLL